MSRTIQIRREGDSVAVVGEHRVSVRHGAPGIALTPDAIGIEWQWDGSSLEAVTDRHGTYPLFYSVSDREVHVSTSISAMIRNGVSTVIDDAAVATFLRLGCCLGEDTPFAAIRRVPPNGRLLWRRDGTWSVTALAPRLTASPLSRAAALDAFIDVFRVAIRRGLPQADAIVPLTGGRDSRHILLELRAAGCRPRTTTVRYFPPRLEEDIRVAQLVAERLAVPCEVLPQYPSRVESETRKNELSSFSCDWNAWFLPLPDWLAKNPGLHVFIGYGGDTLTRGRRVDRRQADLWAAGDTTALADRRLNKRPWIELSLQLILQPSAYRRFARELAMDRLTRELGKYVNDPNPDMSYSFFNGLRLRTAPMWFRMCSDFANIRAPFLDAPVYDLMASLPASLGLDTAFHTEAIAKAFPEYAGIPYASVKDVAPHSNASYHRRFAEELTTYGLSRNTSAFVNARHLADRLSGCRRSGDGALMEWLQPSRILWLLQLETLLNRSTTHHD